MESCVFCKIRDKEVPANFMYEDEDSMVFPDIHPVKPIHLLIVPKKHIPDFLDINDRALMGKLLITIQRMVREHGLQEKGYRISINGGGAQAVHHLHFHLIGPLGKSAAM